MSEYALILEDRVLVYTEHKYALEVYNSLGRKDIQILPVNRVIVRDSVSYIEGILSEKPSVSLSQAQALEE